MEGPERTFINPDREVTEERKADHNEFVRKGYTFQKIQLIAKPLRSNMNGKNEYTHAWKLLALIC